MMGVQPSGILSQVRSALIDLHGVNAICWNTDDDFDNDIPEYREIMEYHRKMRGVGHWYLPFHPVLKHHQFPTEEAAFASLSDVGVSYSARKQLQ